MLRTVTIVAALASLALAVPTARASDAKSDAASHKKASGKKPTFESSATMTATGTVDSVDTKKRTVTFHTPGGDLETVQVGQRVKNLGQVKPGDQLTLTVHEYSRVKVYPAGAAIPESAASAGVVSAKEGEKPAGVADVSVVLSATVEKIDRKTGKVTLKMQDGETRVITARNKKNLENVVVGDQVVLTREKAVAAYVTAPQ